MLRNMPQRTVPQILSHASTICKYVLLQLPHLLAYSVHFALPEGTVLRQEWRPATSLAMTLCSKQYLTCCISCECVNSKLHLAQNLQKFAVTNKLGQTYPYIQGQPIMCV